MLSRNTNKHVLGVGGEKRSPPLHSGRDRMAGMQGKHGNHARGTASGAYRHGEVHQIDGKRVASPEYRSWQMMKNRVMNPDGKDYKYYGGRGITMDPAWQDFSRFLADMGRRPSAELTLERLDSDGPYCKANCVWASRKEQARSRSYCTLDMAQAQAIRRLYATGEFTQKILAYYFNVTQAYISQIILNRTWR